MKKLRDLLVAFAFVVTAGGAWGGLMVPATASAACNDTFLGIPAWYKGLVDGNCDLKSPDALQTPGTNDGLGKFIWTIVLNVITMALYVVGYITVGFIIYGGFVMMTSRGEPDNMAKGRNIIRDAVVGLVISIASIAIVNLILGII